MLVLSRGSFQSDCVRRLIVEAQKNFALAHGVANLASFRQPGQLSDRLRLLGGDLFEDRNKISGDSRCSRCIASSASTNVVCSRLSSVLAISMIVLVRNVVMADPHQPWCGQCGRGYRALNKVLSYPLRNALVDERHVGAPTSKSICLCNEPLRASVPAPY